MNRLPYIPPTTELHSVQLERSYLIVTSNDPYEDNGDYEWDD